MEPTLLPLLRQSNRPPRVRSDLARFPLEGNVNPAEMLAPAVRGDDEDLLAVEVLDDRRVRALRVPRLATERRVRVASDNEMDVP